MSADLRDVTRRALVKAYDHFPDGSGFARNTQAAIDQIGAILVEDGTMFINPRVKKGVLTILHSALEELDAEKYAFIFNELHDLTEKVRIGPVYSVPRP